MLTGFVNQSNVKDYYNLADVFVMCSGYGETWGLSTNEAMNFSLPIILSDMTGSSDDLVDGNGFIFNTDDIDDFASVLDKMVNLPNTERFKMGNRSKEIIAQYDYKVIIENLKN